MVIDIEDDSDENLKEYLDEIYSFISEGLETGNVLVHCFAGMSRSAAAVTWFLMKELQLPYEKALQLVKAKRNGVSPNLGFEMQIKAHFNSIE